MSRGVPVESRPGCARRGLCGVGSRTHTRVVYAYTGRTTHIVSTSQETAAEFFVSNEGNDRWSGRRAAPNAQRSDGPFRTIARAQRAVRGLREKDQLERPARITLRGGTYFFDKPLIIGPKDSGSPIQARSFHVYVPERRITYAAYRNERVVFSGGRRIARWKRAEVNGRSAWAADLPLVRTGQWYFHQLFVNGQRRHRPRLPHKGTYQIERLLVSMKPINQVGVPAGQDRFIFRDGDLKPWRNIEDVEVIVAHSWIDEHMYLRSVDQKQRLATLDRPSRFRLAFDHLTDRGADYYVENVPEALDTPGQWYLDRKEGRLYYLPLDGEDMASAEVIAPVLSEIVHVEGGTEAPFAGMLSFEGITFAHTEWRPPADVASYNQAAWGVGGAVVFKNARYCTIRLCTFENLGGYGVEVLEGGHGIHVVGCDLHDLGGGGVKLWHGSWGNRVMDNEIWDAGLIYHAAVGVLAGRSGGNHIVHNHIHHLFYSGISVGWVWTFLEDHDSYGNVVEYNHIHDIGQGMLSDMGGIYTLGVATGTRLAYNLIHDVESRGYGGWGIYPDAGVGDLLIENNLVYRCKSAPYHIQFGRRNIVRNNIFAFGREAQVMQTRPETGPSFTLTGNIIYFDQGTTISGNHGPIDEGHWTPVVDLAFERNLWFDASGRKVTFEGKTLRQWQAMGMDKGSIIADPLFRNPAKGDFRLRSGSPAQRIGFVEFDLSGVGPRAEYRKRSRRPR